MSEPSDPPPASANQDAEHLRLLAIFHYVVAALTAFFACIPFIHLGIGVFMLLKPQAFKPNPPPEAFAWLFVVIGALAILAGWTLAVLFLLAGRNLSCRRRYLFCQVVAGIGCIFMPFGTVLGVFTLIVLSRPSVRTLFEPADRRVA
jgi:hypothetical protein